MLFRSNDCHLRIADTREIFYDYTDAAIEGQTSPGEDWTAEVSSPLKNDWIITLEKPSRLVSAPANKMAVTIFAILLLCFALIYAVAACYPASSRRR